MTKKGDRVTRPRRSGTGSVGTGCTADCVSPHATEVPPWTFTRSEERAAGRAPEELGVTSGTIGPLLFAGGVIGEKLNDDATAKNVVDRFLADLEASEKATK